VLARVTRSSALEVMRLDFVRTARASGLSRARVLWHHVLPNALVPIVTIVGHAVCRRGHRHHRH
jgi:peptide/nickel transport system permease protein